MAHDVFISYSSKDKPIADAICNGLENDGIRCWVAPRDILPGTGWGESIVKAIGLSKAMVVIFSANSNSSRQVLHELERAVTKNVIVLPFRIEDIMPSGGMEYYIGTEHWLDAITPPLEAHIQRLSATLKILLAGGDTASVPEAARPVPAPAPPRTERKPLKLTRPQLALAGAGAVVFGLACLALAIVLGVRLFTGIGTGQLAGTTGTPQAARPTATSKSAPGLSLPDVTQAPGVTSIAPDIPAGTTWLRLTDLPRGVTSWAVDPTDPQVIYAGTEVYGQQSGYIYKSTDGGLTWTQASNGLDNRAITALAITAEDPPSLYVNTDNDIFVSRDGAASWQKVGTNDIICCAFSRHLYISPADSRVMFITEPVGSFTRSLDGGQNWSAVTISGLPADITGQTIADSLAFDPSNPETIYLGTEGVGVYKSTDGGDTWTASNKGMLDYKVYALAVDPRDARTVYAGSDDGQLFRSRDGGANWEDITSRLGYPSFGFTGEVIDLSIDPSGMLYMLVQYSGVYASADGGETWRLLGKPGGLEMNAPFTNVAYIFGEQPQIFLGTADSNGWRYAADQPAAAATPTLPSAGGASQTKLPVGDWQALTDLPRGINSLAFDPADPARVYAGTGVYGFSGGGLYRSTDGGLTWTAASDLGTEVVYAVGVSPSAPNIVYAAVDVRGAFYASRDKGQTWQKVGVISQYFGNMSTRLYISPLDANMIVMLQGYGPFLYSLDGGQNWMAGALGEPVQTGPGGGSSISVFTTAFDPQTADTVYAGTQGNGVWKSLDGGATWSRSNKGMLDYSISALAVDPVHPQTIYAAGERCTLFKSIDGGGTWVDLTDRFPADEFDRWACTTHLIAIDPSAPDTVYLLADGFGLLGSTDGGLTWRIVGKPGTIERPSFTAAAMIFTPQPMLVVGIDDSGAWLYSVP